MKFDLSGSGTVSQCREQLNAAIAALPVPHTEANAVIRAAAHYVADNNLDPLNAEWARKRTLVAERRTPVAQGGRGESEKDNPDPAEPTTSFSISIDIQVEELKAVA